MKVDEKHNKVEQMKVATLNKRLQYHSKLRQKQSTLFASKNATLWRLTRTQACT